MSAYEAARARTFRDYLRILLRRKLIVAATVIVSVGAAVSLTYFQTPMYQSQAKLLLESRTTQSLFTTDSSPVDPSTLVETEIEVISTEPVQAIVKAKLGSVPPVKAAQVGFTNLISITASNRSARMAAATANAYANAYIEFRRKQALDDLAAGSSELQSRLNDIQNQLNDLNNQQANEPVCVDPKTTAAACAQRTGIDADITTKRTALLNQQALYQQRLNEAQVDSSLADGGASVVTPASASSVPFSPRPKKSAVLAAMLGLVLGVGLALLVDNFDDSIKTKEDFERAVPALSVLSIIPIIGNWRSKDEPKIVSLSDPNSPAAEAYRTLRTSIQFLGVDRPLRSLLVTSASASEGKTTTLVNLGVAMARAGSRVIIACCDLRRPRLHEFFGLKNDIGLTSVLLGEVPLAEALQRVPDVPRLYVLPSGPLPPNPSELLQSRRAADVFNVIQNSGDFLLLDSPPVLPVADGLVLAKRVEGAVIVCAADRTGRKEESRAIEVLRQVNAPLIGAVLNGVTPDGSYGYSNRYYSQTPQVVRNGSVNGNGHSNGSKTRAEKQTAKSRRK